MQNTNRKSRSSPVGEGLQTLPPFGPLRAPGIDRRPLNAPRALQNSARTRTSIVLAQTGSRRGAACFARGRNTFEAFAKTEIPPNSCFHRVQGLKASTPWTLDTSPILQVLTRLSDTIRDLRKMFRLNATPILCFLELTGGFN